MLISDFSKYLERLENTTKRLEITAILVELIQELDAVETQNAINLTLGQLYAPFNNPNFNIAEKMMLRTLCQAFDVDSKLVQQKFTTTGDLGDTAKLLTNKKSSSLTINDVHKKLDEITNIEGTGSQDKKVEKLAKLLKELDSNSAKYITRIVLGTTRLGFTALTVVDALSSITSGSKSDKARIEAKYNIHPDIALIVGKIKAKGLTDLDSINVEVGVPILSQKPQRVETTDEVLEKMSEGEVWVEYKLDGTRVQFHFDRQKPSTEIETLFGTSDDFFVKAYTRNLDETAHQYPDLIEGLTKQVDADSIILDGEAIGFDPKTGKFLDFQQTISRKRKHGISDATTEIPLKYFIFDILYLNGKSLIELSFEKRREILEKVIKPGDTLKLSAINKVSSTEQIIEVFKEAKEKSLEGLVIKNPNRPYEAGARSFTWVKLKRIEEKGYTQAAADSVDCVIMGYNSGRGTRAQFGMGAFLAGIYDEQELCFKTVTKVGSGMTETDLEELKALCDKFSTLEKPSNYNVVKNLEPDVWVTPKLVVELRADEITVSPTHSAGYALRFPRLIRRRPDKNPEQATSLIELEKLYKIQKKID